jgi:hypothetical protein
MNKVKIFGRSDDLIEVEGTFEDEFNPPWLNWGYLHFDEGTIVKAGYDLVEGKGWHIEVVKHGAAVAKMLDPELDDGDHYTDVLELSCESGLTSAKCWGTPEGPSDDDIEDFFGRFHASEYCAETLREVMRILGS